MKSNDRNDSRGKNTFGTISFFVLTFSIAISLFFCWLFWHKIWKFWLSHFAGDHVDPQIFGMLEVFITALATYVAFVTFMNERERRRREREEKKKAFERESKRTQAAFLSQTLEVFLGKLNEFTVAQDSVEVAGKRGIDAIVHILYAPFRKEEMAALDVDDNKMKDINDAFLAECAKINFEAIAKPLWDLCNWVMYQQMFWDSFTEGQAKDGHSLREAFFSVLKTPEILPPTLQYVFGKYRHLKYELDKKEYLDAAHGYRGRDYVDTLLLYRPTLCRLPSSPRKDELMKRADERDKLELSEQAYRKV